MERETTPVALHNPEHAMIASPCPHPHAGQPMTSLMPTFDVCKSGCHLLPDPNNSFRD
jgi:hypothetical protein